MNPLDEMAIQEMLKDRKSFEVLAQTAKMIYDTHIEAGFSDSQALELTKNMVHSMILKGS